MTPLPSLLLLLIPLVGWRLYKRSRRFMARQKSKRWRHWMAVLFFPLLIALIAAANRNALWTEAALAFGVAAGIGIGIAGLRLTRYENTPEGFFFTPNAWIGIALSSLLGLRVLYRYGSAYAATGAVTMGDKVDIARSPLTILIFGLLAGYYVAYGIGLLRWRARETPVTPALPASAARGAPAPQPSETMKSRF